MAPTYSSKCIGILILHVRANALAASFYDPAGWLNIKIRGKQNAGFELLNNDSTASLKKHTYIYIYTHMYISLYLYVYIYIYIYTRLLCALM